MTEQETNVLQRWKDEDKELDEKIDQAYEGILNLKEIALQIGEM